LPAPSPELVGELARNLVDQVLVQVSATGRRLESATSPVEAITVPMQERASRKRRGGNGKMVKLSAPVRWLITALLYAADNGRFFAAGEA